MILLKIIQIQKSCKMMALSVLQAFGNAEDLMVKFWTIWWIADCFVQQHQNHCPHTNGSLGYFLKLKILKHNLRFHIFRLAGVVTSSTGALSLPWNSIHNEVKLMAVTSIHEALTFRTVYINLPTNPRRQIPIFSKISILMLWICL